MMWNEFESYKQTALSQYKNCPWDESSGMSIPDLKVAAKNLYDTDLPIILNRAKALAFVLDNAQIHIDESDWFQDNINCGNIVRDIRAAAIAKAELGTLKEMHDKSKLACEAGAYNSWFDFSHLSPDWGRLLKLGPKGILEEIRKERAEKENAGSLTKEQADYYLAEDIVYSAVLRLLKRQAASARNLAKKSDRMQRVSECLENLSERAPESLLEAMQLAFTFYFLMTRVECSYVRSLGGIDHLYYPFYKADLESGRYTKEQLSELVNYFLYKCNALDVVANMPFYLGGWDYDRQTDRTNEFSRLLVNNYMKLGIYSPKMQIRCNKATPTEFIDEILDCIRKGSSSFVFMNDDVIIPALMSLGESERDASDYTPIGCYEPIATGKEVGCSCNGLINLAKVVELVLNGGTDYLRGIRIYEAEKKEFPDFRSLLEEVKRRIAMCVRDAMDITVAYDKEYPEVTSSPLFSGTYKDSVKKGIDLYYGGAKYNNSSLNIIGLGTAVDALGVIREFVYEKKELSLTELNEILKNNWDGNELLRRRALKCTSKYGNNLPSADSLMLEIYDCLCNCFQNQPNGRGGKFRMGLFSVDNYLTYGEKTGASADGRFAKEPLSKNLSPSVAQDKNGLTSLMNSVTKLDLKRASNGGVLDVILHPSAVSGDDGLAAFRGLLTGFFAAGGQAVHFNVFNAETLRKAQEEPEKYSTLQVRVCGWNAYFTSLSEVEQNVFIKNAENAENN